MPAGAAREPGGPSRSAAAAECESENRRMLTTAFESSTRSVPAGLPVLLSRILVCCPDIQAVWSVGHDGSEATPQPGHDLLLFADRITLHTLRKADSLRCTGVQVLVVFDGDQFENAWGPLRVSGSLARWAWHRAAYDVAYYDESGWAQPEGAGRAVARMRRKAFLIWPSQFALR